MATFKYPQPHTEFWGGIQTPLVKSIEDYKATTLPEQSQWNGGDNSTWDNTTTGPFPDMNVGVNHNFWEITPEEVEAWAAHDAATVAVKYDDNKPDWSLVPFESLEGMVKVLEFGAKKYDGWNWTNGGGFSYTRVLRSCLRHIFSYMRGEDNDPESGLSHIHHAMCNLLFISHYIGNKEKFNKDDRHVR